MLLIWVCLVWLLGIVVGDWLKLPALPLGLIAAACAALGVVWWRQRNVRMPLLLAATCLLGMTWIAMAQPETTARSVWAYTGQKVVLIGTVAQQPDRREDKQSAVLAAELLMIDGGERVVAGLVLLKLAPTPELRYGQRVRLEGKLDQPKSGDDFDYRAYLARHGVYALMTKPKLALLPGEGGTWWQRMMLGLNDRARQTGLQLISEPHASLLVGILLGVQSTIPDVPAELSSEQSDPRLRLCSHILKIGGFERVWNNERVGSGGTVGES